MTAAAGATDPCGVCGRCMTCLISSDDRLTIDGLTPTRRPPSVCLCASGVKWAGYLYSVGRRSVSLPVTGGPLPAPSRVITLDRASAEEVWPLTINVNGSFGRDSQSRSCADFSFGEVFLETSLVGEDGVNWPVGLSGRPHLCDIWQKWMKWLWSLVICHHLK